ncbi:addiction module antidote protein, partial [Aggregatibacter actinomycetemcomitans]
GDIARARNMSQIARETGMSREGLYKALSGTGNPTFATVIKVMKALNLQLQVQPSGYA